MQNNLTMKHPIQYAAVLLLFVVALTACNNDKLDGEWAPMKWEFPSELTRSENAFTVSATGGSFSFKCTNYTNVWLSESYDESGPIIPDYPDRSISGNWYHASCDGNTITLHVDALPDGVENRDLWLNVEAGDAFSHFSFTQK